MSAPILALDLPSGLDATTGETPGGAIRATWSMPLALPITGLAHAPAGELFLADGGIPPALFARPGLPNTPLFGSRFRVPLPRGSGTPTESEAANSWVPTQTLHLGPSGQTPLDGNLPDLTDGDVSSIRA